MMVQNNRFLSHLFFTLKYMIRMIRLLTIAVLFMVIDAIWLGLIMKDNYRTAVYNVQGSALEIKWLPAIMTYLLMAIAIEFFVLNNNSIPVDGKWKYGALLGFVIYGIFNGTNNAIFKGWDNKIAIADTLWGTTVFAIVAKIVTMYSSGK